MMTSRLLICSAPAAAAIIFKNIAMPEYERNREANALAAISRQVKNDPTPERTKAKVRGCSGMGCRV
jgi:hypothetical protein